MSKPVIDAPQERLYHLRESQVLYGHRVTLLESGGPFALVEVPDQPHFNGQHWSGYIGYVERAALAPLPNDVYLGSCARSQAAIRRESSGGSAALLPLALSSNILGQIVDAHWIRTFNGGYIERRVTQMPAAHAFWQQWVGVPYVWGGLQAGLCDDMQGIDCSGLIWSIAAVMGLSLPRNAHDQWLLAEDVNYDRPNAGDLLFLRDANSGRCRHVAICVGADLVLDAAEAYGKSRLVELSELCWWKRDSEQCVIKHMPALSRALRSAKLEISSATSLS